MKTHNYPQQRRGSVLVLATILMIGLFGVLALAVDLGYLMVARTELQRTADAAAIAGAWDLIDENALAGCVDPSYTAESARGTAGQYAALNRVLTQSPSLAQEDVTVGYVPDPFSGSTELTVDVNNRVNAVQVNVRRAEGQNGVVPLFFARIFGIDQATSQAQASAVLLANFGGFSAPTSGQNLGILPFALDRDTWEALLQHVGGDDWTWDEEQGSVTSGPDGILEVNLFPQGTGSPGNRGTVDIGSNNNSTADIARQILEGISAEDLEYHGGSLEFDENAELHLNGDTGISAGVKDELEQIKGESRIIPIFSQVVGPGNNADYTIVQFAGIRIMEVKLTGKMSRKRVIIQPANVVTHGGIAAVGDQVSHFVYSPVWLIR